MSKGTIWKTRDGREIPIKEMEDSHLINTIKYLRRTEEARKTALLFSMFDYMKDAPDGAADCCEMEANYLEGMGAGEFCKTDDRYNNMIKEVKKRGLEV